MENSKRNIDSDEIEILCVIETLDELKAFITDFEYEFDDETPPVFKTRTTSRENHSYLKYFRGHSKESYRLSSTLERYLTDIFGKNYVQRNFEKIQEIYLKECRKVLLEQSIDGFYSLPMELTDNDIWAFGRHYHLKTPLLDWSRSFFVALYFAFEDLEPEQEKYRVIYQLNDFIPPEQNVIITPKIKIGARINAQNGVFTKLPSYQLEKLASHNELKPLGINIPFIGKYLISSKLRMDVLNFLANINIDPYTIYPDLLGKMKACEVGIDKAIVDILSENILENS